MLVDASCVDYRKSVTGVEGGGCDCDLMLSMPYNGNMLNEYCIGFLFHD